MGIPVDDDNQDIDLISIDDSITELEQCLHETFPDLKLDKSTRKQALCEYPNIWPIAYECVTIHIPRDWFWSQDKKEQLLNIEAPPSGCTKKGLQPTKERKCYWRAYLQHRVVITTPNLKLMKDPLTKLFTGCHDPWNSTKLAKCMTPH